MKRRPRPDTRPSWRDLDMPVLVAMSDTGELEPFPPDEVQAANKVWLENNTEPYWKDDPTYNLKRKR